MAASDGFTASYGVSAQITGPDSVCKKITNSSAVSLSEYIPTASVAEWQSFVSNPPSGVTLAICTCALPWGGTLNDGQSVTAYQAASVTNNQCVKQTRTCTDGVLSGTYTHASCYGDISGAAPAGDYCTDCYLENRQLEDPTHAGGIYPRYLLNNDAASITHRCREVGYTTGTALSTFTAVEWCGTYSNARTRNWNGSAWVNGACVNGNVKQARCTGPL